MVLVGECRVYFSEIEVVDQLAEIGLSLDELTEAVRAGEDARNSCSPLDQPGAGGYYSHSRTTRRLREIKLGQGWKASNSKNIATACDPTNTHAVAVSSGNDATGNRRLTPKTKYPRGTASQEVVEANNQLTLAGFEFVEESVDQDDEQPKHTWLLLRYRSRGQLRWELSLPLAVDSDKRVFRWAKRIILPPMDLPPSPALSYRDDEPDEEIVVDVLPH